MEKMAFQHNRRLTEYFFRYYYVQPVPGSSCLVSKFGKRIGEDYGAMYVFQLGLRTHPQAIFYYLTGIDPYSINYEKFAGVTWPGEKEGCVKYCCNQSHIISKLKCEGYIDENDEYTGKV